MPPSPPTISQYITVMETLPPTLPRSTRAAQKVYARTLPRLVALGVSFQMEETIRQYCNAVALSEAAIKELDEGDVVIVSEKTGGKYTHPAVNIVSAANKEVRASGQALGLFPKASDNTSKASAAAPPIGGPASFLKRS